MQGEKNLKTPQRLESKYLNMNILVLNSYQRFDTKHTNKEVHLLTPTPAWMPL